ncbi:APC family permease [Francisellaceae bacterium]|nr:APC family permease [Francisellaceae bacterium]
MKILRKLIGNPIPASEAGHQKIRKIKALAVFSSDALSSVAYATGEILTVLILAGTAALSYSIHISIFICILIVIVGISYKQAIKAYPGGGGAYVVSKENFGLKIGTVAAVALMIDYILTVAVSVSAGVLAMTSAFPELQEFAVIISIFFVIVMMWLNVRGAQESATYFTFPTYAFILMMFVMIGIGVYKHLTTGLPPVSYSEQADLIKPIGSVLTLTLILRAFSSGCSAMTGIEAISNGVTAFKAPAAKNASTTLTALMIILIILFMGTSYLASQLEIQPLLDQSALSQIGHSILGDGLWYYFLQTVTCLILLVAANTSFAGFPLLLSMVSKDGLLPRQFQSIGDRLAFTNGIIFLAIISSLLIFIFDADTSALIPLYSLGVFVAFTLCQAGLVKVWYQRRRNSRFWWFKAVVNGFGCCCTLVAVGVIIESKFFEGAWLIIVAAPLIYFALYKIKQHYDASDKELAISADEGLMETALRHKCDAKVILPVSKLHKGTIAALEFARNLSSDVTPVAVNISYDKTERLQQLWDSLNFKEKLVIVDSQYQSVIRPVVKMIRKVDLREPEKGLAIIVLPKANTTKWWHFALHNQKTALLKMAVNTMSRQEYKGQTRIIVEVPYQLH